MKAILETKTAVVGLLLLAAFGASAPAVAQDTLVALGRVEFNGTLLSSQNTVGGVVSSVQNGAGDFTVTVDAIGAFAGATSTDFVVELAFASTGLDDNIMKSDVSVTDDQLTIDVYSVDVEGAGDPEAGEPQNRDFNFLVRRIPVGAATVVDGTRFLNAHGSVNADGTLANAYGLDGIVVTSTLNATGDYSITLSKAGGFVGDTQAGHLMFLTPINGNTQDQVIYGQASSVSGDDSVTFTVRTTDVQSSVNDNTLTPENNPFWFTIYRLDTGLGGDPHSQFLSALANVRGSDGFGEAAVGAEPGMVVNTARNGVGNYTVTVTALGFFAGKTASDFVSIVTLRQAGFPDDGIGSNAEIIIVNDDTLEIDVNTNDLEVSGQGVGVPLDSDFSLALYSVDPLVQPDLRIGTKRQLTRQKGDDIINSNGASQKIRLKLVDRRKKRFFFTIENDGNVVDDLRLNEVGGGKFLKTKYFDVQGGGRTNVSGTVRTGGEVVSDLRAGKLNRFEAQTRYKTLSKRPKRKLRITGSSIHSPADADTVKAKVIVDNSY